MCAGAGRASSARLVLVFPFENASGRADLQWMAESFPEILSYRLAVGGRTVLGREERNAAYEQLGITPGAPLTLASKYKVAEILGADWAVMGSFLVEDQRLTVRTRLLDMRQMRLGAALEASGALTELVDLQTRLAWRLLSHYDPGFDITSEEDFRRRFPSVRLDAFENYVRGILASDEASRVRFLQHADRLDPTDHRPAFELGRHLFERKDYAGSAKWLRKLKPGDPRYLEARFFLAVDEFFLGNDALAERVLESLCDEAPLSEVQNNLGVMRLRRKAYQEALASFQAAYEADPQDIDFCFNLAISLYLLERHPEAAPYLEQVLRIDDSDAEAHALLANIFRKTGYSEGLEREQRWLAENEGPVPVDLKNGLLPQPRLKRKFDVRAFRLLLLAVQSAREQRVAEQPTQREALAHLLRAKRFVEEARWHDAEHELLQATALSPEDREARLMLARVYEAQGRPHEAAAQLEKSLQVVETAAAHLALARIHLGLGQPAVARGHAEAALRLEPGSREAERIMNEVRARYPDAGTKP